MKIAIFIKRGRAIIQQNVSRKKLKTEGHEVEIIAYKKCYVSIDEKNPKVNV